MWKTEQTLLYNCFSLCKCIFVPIIRYIILRVNPISLQYMAKKVLRNISPISSCRTVALGRKKYCDGSVTISLATVLQLIRHRWQPSFPNLIHILIDLYYCIIKLILCIVLNHFFLAWTNSLMTIWTDIVVNFGLVISRE